MRAIPGTSAPASSRTAWWNLNNKINWVPEHIKEGRFGNWLANNIDWSLQPRALLGHAAAGLGMRGLQEP